MMVSTRVWYVSTIYIRAEGLDATSNSHAPSQFAATGYRQYDKDAVRLVHFIKHAQELGFTLRDISELIALRKNPKNCARAGAPGAGKGGGDRSAGDLLVIMISFSEDANMNAESCCCDCPNCACGCETGSPCCGNCCGSK